MFYFFVIKTFTMQLYLQFELSAKSLHLSLALFDYLDYLFFKFICWKFLLLWELPLMIKRFLMALLLCILFHLLLMIQLVEESLFCFITLRILLIFMNSLFYGSIDKCRPRMTKKELSGSQCLFFHIIEIFTFILIKLWHVLCLCFI
jgi:hypothetical protein